MEQDQSSSPQPKSPWASFTERTKNLFRKSQPEKPESTYQKPPSASTRAQEYETAHPDLDRSAERILMLDDGYHYLHDYDDPAIADYYANRPRSASNLAFEKHIEQQNREKQNRHRQQRKVLEYITTGNPGSLAGEPSLRPPAEYSASLRHVANGAFDSDFRPFPAEPAFDDAAESAMLRKIRSPLDQNPQSTWQRANSDPLKSRLIARLTRDPENPNENYRGNPSLNDLLDFYHSHPTPVEADSAFDEALDFIHTQDRTAGRAPRPYDPDFADQATADYRLFQQLKHDLYGKRQEYHNALDHLRQDLVANTKGNPTEIRHHCENLALTFVTPDHP